MSSVSLARVYSLVKLQIDPNIFKDLVRAGQIHFYYYRPGASCSVFFNSFSHSFVRVNGSSALHANIDRQQWICDRRPFSGVAASACNSCFKHPTQQCLINKWDRIGQRQICCLFIVKCRALHTSHSNWSTRHLNMDDLTTFVFRYYGWIICMHTADSCSE